MKDERPCERLFLDSGIATMNNKDNQQDHYETSAQDGHVIETVQQVDERSSIGIPPHFTTINTDIKNVESSHTNGNSISNNINDYPNQSNQGRLPTTAVGANRKSAFPATPASSSSVSTPSLRRTPRPHNRAVVNCNGLSNSNGVMVHQQHSHRRTLGGTSSNHTGKRQGLHASQHNPPHSGTVTGEHYHRHYFTPGSGGNHQGKGKATQKEIAQQSESPSIPPINTSLATFNDPAHKSSRTPIMHIKSNDHVQQQNLIMSQVVNTPQMTSSNNNLNNGIGSINRSRQLYTPAHFTLSKNPHLNMNGYRPEAFSPNTIRMTDSLDKLLTDDDEEVTVQKNKIRQVEKVKTGQRAMSDLSTHSTEIPTPVATNKKTLPLKTYNYSLSDATSAGASAFHRIQVTASSQNSDDEEMEEMRNIDGGGEGSAGLESNDEHIPVNEGQESCDGEAGKDMYHSKPLNFDCPTVRTSDGPKHSAGAFQPLKKSPLNKIHGESIGATATGAPSCDFQVSLHTPKPQRTIPRPTPSLPTPLHSSSVYHGSVYQEHAMHYPHHSDRTLHHHDAYFTPLIPQEPHNFNHHQPYAQSLSMQPPMSHHYTHPTVPLGNNSFGPPTVISPSTITADYAQASHFHPSMHAMSWSPVPFEFDVKSMIVADNEQWYPPSTQGVVWGYSEGFLHTSDDTRFNRYHPYHLMDTPHQLPYPHSNGQYGMGVVDRNSPDISFHVPGHVSPFMSHRHFPEHNDFTLHQYHAHSFSVTRSPTATAGCQGSDSKEEDYRIQQLHNGGDQVGNVERKDNGNGLKEETARPRKDSTGSLNSCKSTSANISLEYSHTSTQYAKPEKRDCSPANPALLRQALPGFQSRPMLSEEKHGYPGNYPPANETFHKVSDSTHPQQIQQLAPPYLGIGSLKGYSSNSMQAEGQGIHLHEKSIGRSQNLPSSQYLGDRKSRRNITTKQANDHRQPLQTLQIESAVSKGMRPGITFCQGVSAKTVAVDDVKQSEFLETPLERAAFKEFGRQYRQKESESLYAARDYALACLSQSNSDLFLPPSTHWRVYLELADVAKRCLEIEIARQFYRKACALQPIASQGWLEHSKLEEESGNLRKCASIIQEGLRHCITNENLLIRAVKFYERVGRLDVARKLLGTLKHLSIDKSWRTMLEGALVEARAGNYLMARELLKYLTHYVPWYGPLYLAHTKLERDYGKTADAFNIVERGLKELPRYGPLYFQAFRLLEKEDLSIYDYQLTRTMKMISRADNISKELLWKVYLEAAQSHERAALKKVERNPELDLKKCLDATRRFYAKAIMLCPQNLCWKIWLASGRTEVSCGNAGKARTLFLRAYYSVSEKGRSAVLLECARLEEFCCDLELARAILCRARHDFGDTDWKVWLASVNLEYRCGYRERAIDHAQNALIIHSGTGRLWASLIQLRYEDGELHQMKVLKKALQAVPKSGEVWCEGARILLNPFSPSFDLQAAASYLSFASRFTPQYGDSFLERLRLDIIDQCLIPFVKPFIESMHTSFLSKERMTLLEAYTFIGERVKDAVDVVKIQRKKINANNIDVLDTSELELHCSSADPNYGRLWFQCRDSPIDTAREIINRAKSKLGVDVLNNSFIYIAAIVRRAGVIMITHHQADMIVIPNECSSSTDRGMRCPNSKEWYVSLNHELQKAPSLEEMLGDRLKMGGKNEEESLKKTFMHDSTVSGKMFVTGHVESNKSWAEISLKEKRKILFGSDSLLS